MNGTNQKILVVEEDLNDLKLLQTILSSGHFQVIPVTEGKDAVEAFNQHIPDLVILNVHYKDMGGFDIGKQISKHSLDKFIPIIYVTDSKDENVAFGYEVGDEVIVKPFNAIRILGKIKALNRAERRNFLTRSERDELQGFHRQILQEQEIAKKIFDSIAHLGCMSDKNIRYRLSPMALFNGDVILAAKNPVGDMYMFLGDFTGHGLSAAMGAIPISEIFYGMVQKGFELEKVLSSINEKLKTVLPSNIFCASAGLVFNNRNHKLTVFNGGLPPLLIKRLDRTSNDQMIYSKNLPLGILAPSAFEIEINTYDWQIGDVIILYTDGINEAKNAKNELFGSARLKEVFEKNENPKQLYDDILQALAIFNQGVGYNDDCTIVEVTADVLTPYSDEKSKHPNNTIECYHGSAELDWEVAFTFGPKTLKYQSVLPVIMHWLNEFPILKPDYESLYNIIEELYMNALDHGILNIDTNLISDEDMDLNKLRNEKLDEITEGHITVKMKIGSETLNSAITIYIEDSGDGFDHKTVLKNAKSKKLIKGGIQRILPYCASIAYNKKGNAVKVVYRSCG